MAKIRAARHPACVANAREGAGVHDGRRGDFIALGVGSDHLDLYRGGRHPAAPAAVPRFRAGRGPVRDESRHRQLVRRLAQQRRGLAAREPDARERGRGAHRAAHRQDGQRDLRGRRRHRVSRLLPGAPALPDAWPGDRRSRHGPRRQSRRDGELPLLAGASGGADPLVIGRHLALDEQPFTIVGVLPANVYLPGDERSATGLEAADRQHRQRGGPGGAASRLSGAWRRARRESRCRRSWRRFARNSPAPTPRRTGTGGCVSAGSARNWSAT